VYNTSDYSLKNTINLGKGLSETTFSSDGMMAFACNTTDGTVSLIDANSKMIHSTITVGTDPVGAWASSNGKMYVDNELSKTISEISVSGMNVTQTISLAFTPAYVAYSTHHSELWVTDATNGRVVYYSLISGVWTLKGSITTGANAHAIAFSANGEIAYITNQNANTVSVIDVINHSVSKTITVGTKPNGLTLKM
jgi:YVTN family beta-propeller protein